MHITDIKKLPTAINGTHEKHLRSYYVLERVLQMVERGDSKETILELVEVLTNNPSELWERNLRE